MPGDGLARPQPAGASGGAFARPARLARRLRGPAALWLAVCCASLALFLVRFLVPVPVGQSDNRDGHRLLCGLGLGPVTGGHPRFFRFIYFQYVPRRACHGPLPYPSSQLVPLVAAKVATPLFGLPGAINLIALGVLMCVLASVGIASLTVGLRLPLWGRLLVAAAAWLIVADAAFFDVFASPFSEPAALTGLLLVAAGVLYLGRDRRATVYGLILAGAGGFLAILSKEQYLILALPICVTIVLAAAGPGSWRGLRRLRTRQAGAALLVAVLLALMAGGYTAWNYTSHYGRRLEHVQVVDMIFSDIVTGHDPVRADLRALGLPAAWARYAGDFYWHHPSVRTSPLLPRYEGKLTDLNVAHFLLTHPGRVASIGQHAAELALQLRVTTLGDYPPSAGHPPGAYESRVVALTWLAHRLPPGAGLFFLVPLWAVMAVLALAALRLPAGPPWRRDAAVLALCMTGCAVAAFVPPAFFAGISTTRHMVGTNLATALALVASVALAASLTGQAIRGARRPPGGGHPAMTAEPSAPAAVR